MRTVVKNFYERDNNEGARSKQDQEKNGTRSRTCTDATVSQMDQLVKEMMGTTAVASMESYDAFVGSIKNRPSVFMGCQQSITIGSHLSDLIDTSICDAEKIKEVIDSNPLLVHSCCEEIVFTVAIVDKIRVISGSKLVYPALYYATKQGNQVAVRILLKMGIDFNATIKPFRLDKCSYSKEDILRFVGEVEIEKLFTEVGIETAEAEARKQQILDEAKLSIPAWTPSNCSWTKIELAETENFTLESSAGKGNLTPLQLAFAMQNLPIFEAFLDNDTIQKLPGHLVLTTTLPPWPASKGVWPASFANMQSIIALTVLDPLNSGPVPSAIFSLTNLVMLDLHDSGYTEIPDEIGKLGKLEKLNLSSLPVRKVPVAQMASCQKFKSVQCDNLSVASPPPEIIAQGPSAVAQYIVGLGDGAAENHDVLLMLIGDGEAGKTSTLLALKNTETNTARAIGVDDRTIGIDISDFKPYPEAPLRFFAWDFGGQAVYAIMQQLFMSRRALYPLLWRVRESVDVSRFDPLMKCDVCKAPLVVPAEDIQQPIYRVKGQGLCHANCASYDSLITSWTERLQFRVPGVTVVLIATHIDCASSLEVDEQCNVVADIAQRILARQEELGGSIDKLKIYNNGQSLRVNNVSGDGVAELRSELRVIAESLSFYGEVIPSSYARLRMKLREMQSRSNPGSWRTWMAWPEYVSLAKSCGIIEKEALTVATQFFHDTGELRYFGQEAVAKYLPVGTRVEINHKNSGRYYPGRISKVNSDFTYTVTMNDGDVEKNVSLNMLRPPSGSNESFTFAVSSGSATAAKKRDGTFQSGDRVESRYRGKEKYYPGVITSMRANGTYDVNYDDGEKEFDVPKEFIRAINISSTPAAEENKKVESDKERSELSVGTKVDFDYMEKGTLCRGAIVKVNSDSSYQVAFEAGFTELSVPKDRLLVVDENAPCDHYLNGQCEGQAKEVKDAVKDSDNGAKSSVDEVITPGLNVSVFYRRKWEDAEIISIDLYGEFTMRIKSSGKPVGVQRSDWRFLGEDLFTLNARVKARYMGLSLEYLGTITAVNDDETCNILYDAGEVEIGVKKEHMELFNESEHSSDDTSGLVVGQHVRLKDCKISKGIIDRTFSDGTYNVMSVDGHDLIRRVDRELLSPLVKTQTKTKTKSLAAKDAKDRMDMLLSSTVFPNPFWIVDVLRGLIRHDHSEVLRQIEKEVNMPVKTRNLLRRRVHRLMQRGLLHKSLLPYVWAGVAGMHDDPARNQDEFRRLLALLGAFDILMDRPEVESAGIEWVVPSLAAGKNSRTVNGSAFVDESLPFVCRIVYDALPPYFDMMLLAHVMNNGTAQSVDFIQGAASFLNYGDKALVFAGGGKISDPKSVFRTEQLSNPSVTKILRSDQCHVVIASGSRRLLQSLEEQLRKVEKFFPGLRRLATLFPCYSCRQRRLQLLHQTAPSRSFKEIRNLPVNQSADPEKDYLIAEERELVRLQQLEVFDETVKARRFSLKSCATEYKFLSQAYTDYPEFNAFLNLRKLLSGDEYEENESIEGLMKVYANINGVITDRCIREIVYLFHRIDFTCESMSTSSDTFSLEIEKEQLNVKAGTDEFLIQHGFNAEENVNWSTLTRFCGDNTEAIDLACLVCPELKLFGPVSYLRDTSTLIFRKGTTVEFEGLAPTGLSAGVIASVNDNGTYDIEAKSGVRLKNNVKFENIRIKDMHTSLSKPILVGDLVDCINGKNPQRGTVIEPPDYRSRCTIQTSTSEEMYCRVEHIRPVLKVGELALLHRPDTGCRVYVTVSAVLPIGYMVHHDDGTEEKILELQNIKSLTEPPSVLLGGDSQYSSVERGSLAAPLLCALKKVVLTVAPHVSGCPAVDAPEDITAGFDIHEYREFCAANVNDLKSLCDVIPELQLDGHSHFLAQCYGLETPEYYAEHFRMLKSAMRVLETEPFSEQEEREWEEHRHAFVGPFAATVKELAESTESLLSVLNHIKRRGKMSVESQIHSVVEGMVNNYKQAVLCRAKTIKRKIKSVLPRLQDVVTVAKEKVDRVVLPCRKYSESLRKSEVGTLLQTIADQLRTIGDGNMKLLDLKKNLTQNRLSEVFNEVKLRMDEYRCLQQMRAIHAPVWHMGLNMSEDRDQNYNRRQNRNKQFSMEDFMSGSGGLTGTCPAEIEVRGPSEGRKDDNNNAKKSDDVILYPADLCSIFISHSEEFKFIGELIKSSLAKEGINVVCVISSDSKDCAAVREAKIVICCIDSTYAEHPKRIEEYLLASQLRKEVIPVILCDYKISSYQRWWPESMSFLERHSLFVNMKSVTKESNNEDPGCGEDICSSFLVPTVRQLLSEWTPPSSIEFAENDKKPTRQMSAHNIETKITDNDAAVDENGRFIVCEACALEGDRSGRFDRRPCKQQLDQWITEELERRGCETQDSVQTTALCPLKVCCSGAEKHEMLLTDLIARRVQETSIPCPRCRSSGVLPPFCFQREACLAELEYNRGGSLNCKRCHQTVPLFELLKSEVFVSYNWGRLVCPDPSCSASYWNAGELTGDGICPSCEKRQNINPSTAKYSTQLLVTDLKTQIEEEAGVTCWQDLDRLVGGKNLVEEMEAGIRFAEVVVIFLNDVYTRSVNCMKEYLFATKHGKYVVPVLLRGYSGLQTNSDGTVQAKKKWWPENMSSLEQFSPVLLLRSDQQEDALFEICERIQSRFHRAQRFATASDAITYLRDYSSWQTMRKAFLRDEAMKGSMKRNGSDELPSTEDLETRLEKIFQEIDVDANGFVDADEMALYLDKQGSLLSHEQVSTLLSEADVDCDGQLSLEEFKLAVLASVKSQIEL